MHPTTELLASELDVLYGLYELAAEYTLKIKPDEPEKLTHWLDARQRILGKTKNASQSAAALMTEFKALKNIPANEKALIEEKKSHVMELVHKMKAAESGLMRNMHHKMSALRAELAGVHKRKRAARAYINAPPAHYAVT